MVKAIKSTLRVAEELLQRTEDRKYKLSIFVMLLCTLMTVADFIKGSEWVEFMKLAFIVAIGGNVAAKWTGKDRGGGSA